ncbi:putative alpha/beta superfamily hydrolase [Mucilaginibacter frigoritolerans]|uniref:Putative alpha/beta superfamily hydrolase n=2 Tax=Mucilaginibacter frigoritolerans TaxID=652788 RepID=A0A562TQP3_9SPHI|nr:putative alpha/beta superfamily hydrolase [Mucilaginibacter frigoritolerans]
MALVTLDMANAQDTLLTVHNRGKLDSLHSAILGQERLIQVFTPPGYKPGSTEKYDVLYVLDGGNWNISLMTKVQTFLEAEGFMPSTIIVSVMGIDRNHELTPTHLDSWKDSGGGAKFLGFIKNELIPYVNKNYPSNGDNTLWGHSLGGMFVLYALLNEPTLFKSYVAIDPSVWWDNSYVAKMAIDKLPALIAQNTTLFIAARQESLTDMKTDTINIILKKAAPPNLTWKFNTYSEETHSSVRLKGTYDGLKFIYLGLTGNIQFHPMNGIVLKDKPYKIFCFDDTTRMHYTLDGTAPTPLSPKAQQELAVTGAATVTYKVFTNRSKYDKTITGVFSTEKMPAPLSSSRNLQQGGFNYAYYEGKWDKWPNLKGLKPVKTGVTDKDFDVDKLPRKNNYALLIDGWIEVKEDGYYVFAFDADNGSKLYIGNKLLIQWDGDYNKRTYSCIVPLSKGFYPLRIEYLHQHEDFKLKWAYLTPSTMETKNTIPVPVDLQYNRK